MRLLDAYNLLVGDGITDNHRYFAEVYKGFQFTDEHPLKEYLEFVLHEPLEWMRGFPGKLISKTSFSKPKTALIKLLKKTEVTADVGESLVEQVYDAVWNTYKKEHEKLIADREAKKQANIGMRLSVVEQFDTESFESLPVPPLRQSGTKSTLIAAAASPEDDTSSISSVEIREVGESLYNTALKNPTADCILADSAANNRAVEHRIQLLKSILFKMATMLPPGASDAFCVLVEAV
jgi:hypothetical protein